MLCHRNTFHHTRISNNSFSNTARQQPEILNMQFKTLFLALGLAAAAAAKCACQKVSNPGLYCGYCTQVTSGWVGDNIYWCNKQGGCDDYGFSRNCAARTPRICDGRYVASATYDPVETNSSHIATTSSVSLGSMRLRLKSSSMHECALDGFSCRNREQA